LSRHRTDRVQLSILGKGGKVPQVPLPRQRQPIAPVLARRRRR